MKFFLPIFLIVAGSLSACSVDTPGEDTNEPRINQTHIELDDGREVECLINGRRGGMDCDWDNAK